jgi:hypothetical protein
MVHTHHPTLVVGLHGGLEVAEQSQGVHVETPFTMDFFPDVLKLSLAVNLKLTSFLTRLRVDY